MVGRSLGGVASVDGECDSDDEAGAGAAQPQDGCGDLLAMAEAADRSPGGRLGPVDLTLGPMSATIGVFDGARADSVDADSVGRVLHGGACG
jgi:hypothetical protein